MSTHWLFADRTRLFDASGIRKVFDLARKCGPDQSLRSGQPDFDVPERFAAAAIDRPPEPAKRLRLTQACPSCATTPGTNPEAIRPRRREVFVLRHQRGLMLALLVL